MITIEDIVRDGRYASAPESAETDPLRETDALQESQLLDCRVCPLTATAALLVELRTALQFDVGNSALLVVRGLRSFNWISPPMPAPLMALSIISSIPDCGGQSFQLNLDLYPDSDLVVQGDAADFYVLNVEGLSDVPPDYSEGDLTKINHDLPAWSSVCMLLQSSSSR